MIELAAGKNVARQGREFRPLLLGAASRRALARARYRVVQIETARLQEPMHCPEIGREVRDADRLEHADRTGLVEARMTLHRGIVLELERDLVREPEPFDFLTRVGDLLLRQR